MRNHVSRIALYQGVPEWQQSLFQIAPVNERFDVALTDEVQEAIEAGAAVAVGVSGGKDSSAVAIRTFEHLDAGGHTGPRLLIHGDLGRIEWRQSLPVCERLAKYLGTELVVVRRQKGDLLDRFWQRWYGTVHRYANLSCVRLILPWSTAAMRFCTSELKTGVICRELVRRFPGSGIVSVSGIRREESSARAKAAISEIQLKLRSVRSNTHGLDWRPILHWSKSGVFRYLSGKTFDLHEAYTSYGSSRVSCAFCILSSEADLTAAAGCESNTEIYRELVRLETESTFSFQNNRWLADVAPHLLCPEQRRAAGDAKRHASLREAAEARIPSELLYTKGWPSRMPTLGEANALAEVRQTVSKIVGIPVRFTGAESICARYAQLLAARAKQ